MTRLLKRFWFSIAQLTAFITALVLPAPESGSGWLVVLALTAGLSELSSRRPVVLAPPLRGPGWGFSLGFGVVSALGRSMRARDGRLVRADAVHSRWQIPLAAEPLSRHSIVRNLTDCTIVVRPLHARLQHPADQDPAERA